MSLLLLFPSGEGGEPPPEIWPVYQVEGQGFGRPWFAVPQGLTSPVGAQVPLPVPVAVPLLHRRQPVQYASLFSPPPRVTGLVVQTTHTHGSRALVVPILSGEE